MGLHNTKNTLIKHSILYLLCFENVKKILKGFKIRKYFIHKNIFFFLRECFKTLGGFFVTFCNKGKKKSFLKIITLRSRRQQSKYEINNFAVL